MKLRIVLTGLPVAVLAAPVIGLGASRFSDVPADHPQFDAIRRAVAEG